MICNIESYLANGIKQNESYDALARICNLITIFKSSCESNYEGRLVQFINALDELRIELADVYRNKEDEYIKDIARLDNKLASIYEKLHEKDAQLTLKDREFATKENDYIKQNMELSETINLKDAQLKLKDARIDDLLQQLEDIKEVFRETVKELTDVICAKNIEIDKLETQLREPQEEKLSANVKQSFENCKMDIEELKARVRALERSQEEDGEDCDVDTADKQTNRLNAKYIAKSLYLVRQILGAAKENGSMSAGALKHLIIGLEGTIKDAEILADNLEEND